MLVLALLCIVSALAAASPVPPSPATLTYTGATITSDGPFSPGVVLAGLPQGRPVYTYTPQVTEHRQQEKTVKTTYNAPVPRAVHRKKVVQDVHHKFIAQPYAVPKPYNVPQPYPVIETVPVYYHEVEVKDPVQVVRHHTHSRKVQHFPLVKTGDVVHHHTPVLHTGAAAVVPAVGTAVQYTSAVVPQPPTVYSAAARSVIPLAAPAAVIRFNTP